MRFGISIYPGLELSGAEQRTLLRLASARGVTRLFTSLHLPETKPESFIAEGRALLQAARDSGFDIIADVSPAALKTLGLERFEADAFAAFGIRTLRLDEGFSPAEIARFSHNPAGLRLQLNASTLSRSDLDELKSSGADFSHFDALHNFYPRPGTGLSLAFFRQQNDMLRQYGLSVGAFIPSSARRRAPLHAGLPTLEFHREMPPNLAARHLAALGVDSIFIGDDKPSEAEIATLAAITPDTVALRARLLIKDTALQDLLSQPFTARPDAARDALRAMEGRTRFHDIPLPPENTLPRPFGAITVDNQTYPRYAGELQIIKRPQGANPRTNVVAHVLPEEQFLIPLICPGQKFTLHFQGY